MVVSTSLLATQPNRRMADTKQIALTKDEAQRLAWDHLQQILITIKKGKVDVYAALEIVGKHHQRAVEILDGLY